MERTHRGFTLIELLIVVAVIGIIAAIAIPNLLNALHRGRQKRTMSDMRTIATAVGSYESDASYFPRAITSMADLEAHLMPVYMKAVPTRDGWLTEMYVESTARGNHYTLVSYGKNKVPEPFGGYGTLTNQFNADIWITDHEFVQFPDGLQIGE